jgi:hypothetical protein
MWYSLVEGPIVGARGRCLRPPAAVVMPFVDNTHQLHPGVVLCVAPYATGLPHGDGTGYCDTSASKNKPRTPLISVEGVVVDKTLKTFLLPKNCSEC